MVYAWELASEPANYRRLTHPVRNGVWYEGAAPAVTLASGAAAGTTYEVRDYYGTVVSSGSVTTGATSVTPTAPGGGWPLGWYRLYLLGAENDTVYGHSRGATNFCVIRDDDRFPTMPADSAAGRGAFRDLIGKAILGLGTSRLGIYDTAFPHDLVQQSLTDVLPDLPYATAYWSNPGAPYADPARPRPLWSNVDVRSVDYLTVDKNGGGNVGHFYRASTAAPTALGPYIEVTAGSVSGRRVKIRDTSGGAVVEDYDNNPDNNYTLSDRINAASTRVRYYPLAGDMPGVTASAPITHDRWDGLVEFVTAVYPAVTHYEGPTNEPRIGAEAAHQMKLFAAAVRTAAPEAQVMGPCPVDIADLDGWRTFLRAGGADVCDLLAFHDYNSMTNGCLPQGRLHIERFLAMLEEEGYDHLPMWQTEAGAGLVALYGVHHPRRARIKALHTLLWEQYGIPRERNPYWYDTSHGFWEFPAWWSQEDRSVSPDAPIHRVLAEETFGKVHTERLAFGDLGDRIFLGSVYAPPGGGDAVHVHMATSWMPDTSVTYTVTGATEVEVVSTWGVVTTVAVTAGRAVVPVTDTPTYLRVPTGVTAEVYRCNDWPPLADLGAWLSASPAATATIDGDPRPLLGDDAWPADYGNATGLALAGDPISGSSVAMLEWPTGTYFDRLLIWGAYGWQLYCTPLAFTVEATVDGEEWTQVAEVDVTDSATAFRHGTGTTQVGAQVETFWNEQWVFDVKLDTPVAAKAVRVIVTDASYGGEPDALAISAGGQGLSTPTAGFMEVAVLSDANTQPSHVVLPPVEPPGPVTIAADDFNRADSVATTPTDGLIGQLTPEGSLPWLNLDGSGGWSVVGGKAVGGNGLRHAGVDSGVHDCTISADVASAGAAQDHGLTFLYVNSSNFCTILVDPGGFYIQKTVSGSQTNLANQAVSVPSGYDYTLSLVIEGTSLTLLVDGVEAVSTSLPDAVFAGATKHGLSTGGATGGGPNVTFDNFSITVP